MQLATMDSGAGKVSNFCQANGMISNQRDRVLAGCRSSVPFGYIGCPGVKQKISELSSMGLLRTTTQCTINNILHFLSPITQVFQMFSN